MKDFPNITLIGLGHKARSGKDSTANFLKQKLPNVEIIHWADGVYEEAKNENSKYPLITVEVTTPGKVWYGLLDNKEDGTIKAFSAKDVPYLHKIFTKRNIKEYWGMQEKDPEILQFWGTNFRRAFCDTDYWVKSTFKKIYTLCSQGSINYIVIPDTRFKNEVIALKNHGGIYIKVVRMHPDGNLFIANDRDSNHSSEIDLDDYPADYTFTAINLTELEQEIDKFLYQFK